MLCAFFLLYERMLAGWTECAYYIVVWVCTIFVRAFVLSVIISENHKSIMRTDTAEVKTHNGRTKKNTLRQRADLWVRFSQPDTKICTLDGVCYSRSAHCI